LQGLQNAKAKKLNNETKPLVPEAQKPKRPQSSNRVASKAQGAKNPFQSQIAANNLVQKQLSFITNNNEVEKPGYQQT